MPRDFIRYNRNPACGADHGVHEFRDSASDHIVSDACLSVSGLLDDFVQPGFVKDASASMHRYPSLLVADAVSLRCFKPRIRISQASTNSSHLLAQSR